MCAANHLVVGRISTARLTFFRLPLRADARRTSARSVPVVLGDPGAEVAAKEFERVAHEGLDERRRGEGKRLQST
jgi:hypothetical protein